MILKYENRQYPEAKIGRDLHATEILQSKMNEVATQYVRQQKQEPKVCIACARSVHSSPPRAGLVWKDEPETCTKSGAERGPWRGRGAGGRAAYQDTRFQSRITSPKSGENYGSHRDTIEFAGWRQLWVVLTASRTSEILGSSIFLKFGC